MSNQSTKFKKNQLIVTKRKVSDCGCSWLPVGTIVKAIDPTKDSDDETRVKSCKNGCTLYIENEDLRVLSLPERVSAKGKFEKATEYAPATVE
jgi:hypothetical protein